LPKKDGYDAHWNPSEGIVRIPLKPVTEKLLSAHQNLQIKDGSPEEEGSTEPRRTPGFKPDKKY